jgi:hypothetical protein
MSTSPLRVDLYTEVRQLSERLNSAKSAVNHNEQGSEEAIEVDRVDSLQLADVLRLQQAIEKWSGLEDRIRSATQGEKNQQVNALSFFTMCP